MSVDRGAADPANFIPGSFGCHEALHMAIFFAGAVDEHLANHPAVVNHPEWKALADDAARALGDLYQRIGSEHLGAADPGRG